MLGSRSLRAAPRMTADLSRARPLSLLWLLLMLRMWGSVLRTSTATSCVLRSRPAAAISVTAGRHNPARSHRHLRAIRVGPARLPLSLSVGSTSSAWCAASEISLLLLAWLLALLLWILTRLSLLLLLLRRIDLVGIRIWSRVWVLRAEIVTTPCELTRTRTRTRAS